MTENDNFGFELDEKVTEVALQPVNLPISPIIRRTSTYYEHIDTNSIYSESTLPSELVEKQIEEYKKQQRIQAFETEEFERNNNIQYKLRIDKVLIVGGANESKEKDINIDEPVSHAVHEILTNRIDFDKIERECILRNETRMQKLQRHLNKKRVSIPIIILLLALIGGLSYTTYYFFTYNLSERKIVEPESAFLHEQVKREVWQGNETDSMQLTGKYKIISPVKRIILLETQTDMCTSKEDCINFMLEHQQNAYPEYDDIRENFIIAEDGTVFEGRGFMREGETTCENDMITCYNKNSISIAFVRSFTKSNNDVNENNINEQQHSAFCEFIKNNTEGNGKNIDESFNVFHHDNLISSATFDSNEHKLLDKCIRSFNNVPEIERRVMIENDLIDDSLIRHFCKNVLVTTTNGEFCGSKENCQEIIKKFKANFIIGGEGNLIFADNNFDLAVSEGKSSASTYKSINQITEIYVTLDMLSIPSLKHLRSVSITELYYDTLVVLFIGNYATNQPSQSLITEVFSGFIKYAIVLEKLSMDFKICVTNEATKLTNEIKAKYNDKYDNFCNSQ
ncbi:hypothetical protein PVAND_002180 [Polypedilum vanderplanki]|uniref:Uncharacterized protein n=1 Tax=Polypedilum vanderplanki TaxID=319348 RepID=A0A9J6BQJ3_POLVA|nr:hypothetical protein PVAND_002180 [Polypedilum vanderplanki]